MYEATKKKDNAKLTGLRGQMQDMSQDFEEMKKAREEAKRQLDARFKDVYDKIQDNKDYTIAEGKRVNETLKAFQQTFENSLTNLKNDLEKQLKDEGDYARDELRLATERMDKLEQMITQEREDRIRQTDENLNPIRNHLKSLQTFYEEEKSTRVKREQEIMQSLNTESKKLHNMVDNEREERKDKLTELKGTLDKDIGSQTSYAENFQKNATEEFGKMKSDLENEMSNRFSHQDEIVEDFSKFVRTFQNTLKIVGKDV